MRDLLNLIGWMLLGLFRSKTSLEADILALRHQLNVLRRTSPRRPVFSNFDRMIFVCLYRIAAHPSAEWIAQQARRHVVGRAHHTLSSVIGTGSTERRLRAASERWAFATDRQRRDHHERTGMRSTDRLDPTRVP